jgi:hypothetical protein
MRLMRKQHVPLWLFGNLLFTGLMQRGSTSHLVLSDRQMRLALVWGTSPLEEGF